MITIKVPIVQFKNIWMKKRKSDVGFKCRFLILYYNLFSNKFILKIKMDFKERFKGKMSRITKDGIQN